MKRGVEWQAGLEDRSGNWRCHRGGKPVMGEVDPQEEVDPAEPKGSQGNKSNDKR